MRRQEAKLVWRGFILAVAGLVALGVAAGCAAPQEPLVVTAPWGDGEHSVLELTDTATGAAYGTTDVQWSADADSPGGWILERVLDESRGTEAWILHVGSDLVPTLAEADVNDPSGADVAWMAVKYGDGQATVNGGGAAGASGSSQFDLPEPPFFDLAQVMEILRALPLAEGWSARLYFVTPISPSDSGLCQVTVTGRETVTVPAGTFDCWVVEENGPGEKTWIAVEAPHQLVKFQVEGQGVTGALAEYEAGR